LAEQQHVPPDESVPVLIVGGGPVGLIVAIDLARRGIRSLTVDQTDGSITFPTGEAMNARTMEHFRHWGIADRVRYSGFPPDYRRNVRFVTRVMTHQLTCFERTSNSEASKEEAAVSPEGGAWCPKFFLDPTLRAYAATLPAADVRYGWRCESLEIDAHGVTARVREGATGHARVVRAAYVVGCDGGASLVRRSAGIRLEGAFAEGQNLGIYFRAPTLLREHPYGEASQYWLVNRDGVGPVSAVDGRETWRLSIEYPTEALDRMDPRVVVSRALGADLPFEIIQVQPWAGHRVVAAAYRAGRVFLAGDSCHMMWPRGGFGLNTGVGDALNLTWKLAAVIQGWGGDALLASYDAERRPVGWRNVNRAAENRAAEIAVPIPDHLEDDDEGGARIRAEIATFIQQTRRKEWATLGIALGYRYDSEVVVPDASLPPSDDPSIYEPTARPGSRAPHVWMGDGRSTLDLLGGGFTLLCFGDVAEPAPIVEACARRVVPLDLVESRDSAAADLYGCRLVLVRPDGHVAWRGDAPPRDPLAIVDTIRGIGPRPNGRR
jgi:2-polyprenyl-6-methoxyphenol hydroxylase-like FAD-dependent oxidoreductase